MNHSPRRLDQGVTLLETMIALAVMALVSLIIASSLGTGARLLNLSGEVGAELDHSLNRLQLRAWIERAASSGFPGRVFTGFSGDANHLVVELLPDDSFFWPGAPAIATVTASSDGTITVGVTGLSSRDKVQNVDLDLSTEGAGLNIEYFGSAGPESQPMWQDDWQSDFGLPLLVRLSAAGDASAFPPLVIKPGKVFLQREMSLSSLLPPIRPSRP